MNDFLVWLSSNSATSMSIAVAIIVIVLVVILLYVIAFIQGREISFYPPKIGQKTTGFSKSSHISLEDRSEYTISFEKRLSPAKNVALSGSSLVGVLTHYKGFIQSKAKTGCKFRFLIPHPEIYQGSGKRNTAAREEILNAIQILENLSKNENIKYRVMLFQPQFSLLLVDANTPESVVQVEIYPYESIASERPHFEVSQKNNSKWYSFFSEQFELAWTKAKEYQQNESA